MKILITGANGMLGANLCLMYSKEHEVYATDIVKPTIKDCKNYKLDITNDKDIKLITAKNPNMIVHCAALVNVDYCEEHPSDAEKINIIGTKKIAEAAKRSGSYLVHISTDSVFDGEKGSYDEMDVPNPINVYAKKKLEAEVTIEKINGSYAIVRTNIYGWNRQNKKSLAEWMLDKLENNEELPAVKDVHFCPILVNNLGEAILELHSVKYKGILNIAGSEGCSKLEFAEKIAKIFKLEKKLIKSVKSESLELKAKRPKNMTLDVSKAKKMLKTKLLNVEEGLKRFKELRENGFVDELKNEK